jgi:hypothetical protein
MNSRHVAGLLRFALSAAFVLTASSAIADTPVSQAPLELTAANIANMIAPLVAEWIDKHNGCGAVVVVVQRDGPVFGFCGHRCQEAIHR